jgi:hypothetical protein
MNDEALSRSPGARRAASARRRASRASGAVRELGYRHDGALMSRRVRVPMQTYIYPSISQRAAMTDTIKSPSSSAPVRPRCVGRRPALSAGPPTSTFDHARSHVCMCMCVAYAVHVHMHMHMHVHMRMHMHMHMLRCL